MCKLANIVLKLKGMQMRHIGLLLVIIFSLSAYAADHPVKALGPAVAEVVYKRTKCLDTTKVGIDYRIDLMTLKAGKSASAFYSDDRRRFDSICEEQPVYGIKIMEDFDAFERVAHYDKEVIFKNYPIGENTVLQRYDLDNWIYTEPRELPQWTMVNDSTRNVCGYDCFKAEATWRGRMWTAWYAPEIPLSDGPWKLGGLPGLILMAYDSRMHYVYEAQSIKFTNIGNVEYFNYFFKSLKTERTKGLTLRRKALGESIKNKIVASGAFGIDRKNVKQDAGRPPHTNYDFEETDYPHK